MALPAWAYDYPAMEDRKYPDRFTNDYFRDSLSPENFELEQACVDGDVWRVRELIEGGCDKNAPLDNNLTTPLMIACTMGNWDLLQLLVEDFDCDLDGPVSRAGMRAIDYAGSMNLRFPNDNPCVDYLKSKGSQHTWWGACQAGDFKRMKEYIDNGQDVNEVNPFLWNSNGVNICQEHGQARCAQWLITKGGLVAVRNCHNVDTLEEKWCIGRGDAFYYKQARCEKPEYGVADCYVPAKA